MPETPYQAVTHSGVLVFDCGGGVLRGYTGVRTVQSTLEWAEFGRARERTVVAAYELDRLPDAPLVATFPLGGAR